MNPRPPMFKLEFSLGTIVQLVTMLGCFFVAYVKFENRVTAQERALVLLELRLDKTEAREARHEEMIATVVNNNTRLTAVIEERTKSRQ